VLKPLCGIEPNLFENLSTFCTQAYAGPVQVVFGVRDLAVRAVLARVDDEVDAQVGMGRAQALHHRDRCGIEPNLFENLSTFCTQAYAGPVQVVFGVQNAAGRRAPPRRGRWRPPC
jgi:hypothetical protein